MKMRLFGNTTKKGGLEKVPVIVKKFDRRDEAIGRQLNKSARQVCKMREIAKKEDTSFLEKIQNGSISINKSHELIKAAEARKKAGAWRVESF